MNGPETLVYGVLSLALLIAAGVGGRRVYNEYKNRNSIKKEINRRFRLNRDDENPPNDLNEGLSSNKEEENKGSNDGNSSGGNQPAKDSSIFSRGLSTGLAMASGLAAKVNFKKGSKKEEEDDDPSKYHQLDDGADQQENRQQSKTTRLWSAEGVKIVDETNQVVVSSEPSQASADLLGSEEPAKVKASVFMAEPEADVPAELQNIDLDPSTQNENQEGIMQEDDNL